jgi:N-acetylglucosamine-6-phosphate deacetylase
VSDLMVCGGQVLTPAERLDADVVIRDGRITTLVPREGARPSRASGSAGLPAMDADLVVQGSRSSEGAPGGKLSSGNLPVLDATGMLVTPGFLDLQCNGAGGVDLTAEPERLAEVAALLPRWGVTAWLPTIVTSPPAVRQRAMSTFASLADNPSSEPAVGAVPLGLHLEGPFLAPERRGAHAEAHLVAPDPALVDGWSRDAGVAIVTLAPELPGALDLARHLADRGIVVSMGHSSASAAQATAAIDAGVRWVTHLFNAMAPLHHRDPGLAGVALIDERVAVGAIVDGLHLHPTVVDLAARALGPRLTLVTDAVAALGMGPGPVRLGDVEALADDEGVRLADGTLAGSLLSMDRAIANTVRFAGLDVAAAVAAATVQPARVLGLDHERGVIAPGAVGDLVLLDDDLRVLTTVVAGTIAHASADPTTATSGSPPAEGPRRQRPRGG